MTFKICTGKLLILFLIVVSSAAAEEPEGYTSQFTLRSNEDPQTTARVLTAIDWTDTQELKRIVVQAPDGNVLVLSRVYSPLEGRTWSQIRQVETGWTAVWKEVSDLRFERFDDIFRPAAHVHQLREGLSRKDSERRAQLSISGLPTVSVTVDLESDDIVLRLVEALKASEDEPMESLLFLHSLLQGSEAPMAEFREFVEVLADWTRGNGSLNSVEHESWVAEDRRVRRGTSVADVTNHSLLTGTASLNPDDLLADLRHAGLGVPM